MKLYKSLCPYNTPKNAVLLPKPPGRNTLEGTVARLRREADISGFKTTVLSAQLLLYTTLPAGVDEQLVIERTGHRSLEGVRSYKRRYSSSPLSSTALSSELQTINLLHPHRMGTIKLPSQPIIVQSVLIKLSHQF